MSEPAPRIIQVADVLATAQRLVDSPDVEACHLAIDERVALAAYALAADQVIRAAGLRFPASLAELEGAP